MLLTFTDAVNVDPLIVVNSENDDFIASHLAVQGFFLARGRLQLREIIESLRI